MGLADLFKASKNKSLKEENESLKEELNSLREKYNKVVDEFKNSIFKLESKIQKYELHKDSSFLFDEWIKKFSAEYAEFYCYKLLKAMNYSFYCSWADFERKKVNRESNLYLEIRSMIREAALSKAINAKYPTLSDAISKRSSKEAAYLMKCIEALKDYSYEDLKNFQSDKRAFLKMKDNLIKEYEEKEKQLNLKERELKKRENERQIYWKKKIEDQKVDLEMIFNSSIKSIPYVAALSSDYVVSQITEMERFLLNRRTTIAHEKEVKIRPIKKACQDIVEEAKIAIYQLEYLRSLYPSLDDILDTEYRMLPFNLLIDNNADPVSQWIKKDEYETLTESKRNQLALERYIESRNKTKWQIGRDYELSIGYKYEKKGFTVDYFGSFNGIEDLGRDLIAKQDNKYEIIQCKYWSSEKTIHEKHIYQLYGTMLSFAIENKISPKNITGTFVTNIDFSDMAKKAAKMLGIVLKEHIPFEEFPRIKCNIAIDGERIYHLPIDQQYDMVKLTKEGETKVFKVREAEKLGFRRAWRWYGE